MTELNALVRATIEALQSGGVPDEALAELKSSRKLGPLTLPMTLVPVGRAWRLGEVLVDRDAQLYSTGSVTRAIAPKDFAANKSPAEEERRELQRAAVRGRFRPGDTVNFGFSLLEPGVDREGTLMLRLQHTQVPLETYLADRMKFAITPGWD